MFERQATRRLIEDMLAEQTALTGAVLKGAGKPAAAKDVETARAAVASWAARHPEAVKAVKGSIDEIEQAGGGWSFAKLTIVNAALRELVAGA